MAKGVFFVAVFFFLGLLLIIFQGNGIKGLVTQYLTESKGYICEQDKCYQCVINDKQCFCQTETCTCGDQTIDKKLCTVKILWKDVAQN